MVERLMSLTSLLGTKTQTVELAPRLKILDIAAMTTNFASASASVADMIIFSMGESTKIVANPVERTQFSAASSCRDPPER